MRATSLFALLASPLVCFVSSAQQSPPPLPKDHPPVSERTREQAARLTEQIAGPAASAAKAAPVAHRNFIDEHIFGKMERDKIPHAPLATDEEFFRRIHLDLTGRIGSDEALRQFAASADAGKRDKLIDTLIGSQPYRAKWAYWLGDLSMAAANRVGNEGKNLYYRYLYDNIQLNRPYNVMVTDMLTTNAVSNWYVGPASYLARWVVIGLTCEDTVHEDTSDELAIHTAKHFLGIDLQCVSCHDGRNHLEKINTYLTERKRDELWKMAAFFGKTRILRRTEIATTQDEYSIDDNGPGYDSSARTVVRIPRKGKGAMEPQFMLTGEKPDPAKPLRAEYARMLTSHPQFARATVNMFWAEFMGAGIVDPVFEFDLNRLDGKSTPQGWKVQPTHPELLEALAKDFMDNGYNLQRLFKLIAKSSAYGLSSKFPGEWKGTYTDYYARKFVRRLKAEEIYDSMIAATGLHTGVPIRGTDFVAKYATETRSPEDFKGKGAMLKDINFFLEAFGQTNREYAGRTNDGDITQAVLLMNSPFVLRQVKAEAGSYLARLLDEKLSPDENVGRLFERFLQRRPAPGELAMSKDLVATRGRQGYEDLQWLLLNKVEFVFNY
jgi:hypothetical protein